MHRPAPTRLILGVLLALSLAWAGPAHARAWIAADWAGHEPQFAPGSLHFHTNTYKTCPVLYRATLEVDDRQVAHAGFRVQGSWYVIVYLDGKQVASYSQKGEGAVTKPLDVELTHLLQPDPNDPWRQPAWLVKQGIGGSRSSSSRRRHSLVISTTGDGFSLDGAIRYVDGKMQQIGVEPRDWRVQKFPPLTMVEYEPCMKPQFDAQRDWFGVQRVQRPPVVLNLDEIAELCRTQAAARLAKLDEDGRWRLRMLAQRGIAIVDWEAFGWAGAARLPQWVRDAAARPVAGKPGAVHDQAEALARFVRLNDEATNAANYVTALRALKAPAREVEACRAAALAVRGVLDGMARSIKAGRYAEAVRPPQAPPIWGGWGGRTGARRQWRRRGACASSPTSAGRSTTSSPGSTTTR